MGRCYEWKIDGVAPRTPVRFRPAPPTTHTEAMRMWVLTEDGQLVNLAHVSGIFDNPYTNPPVDGVSGSVIADLPGENRSVHICTYDDAGQGGRVIEEIGNSIHRGERIIRMSTIMKKIEGEVDAMDDPSPTRETEREKVVTEFGDCCMGADP